MAGSIVQNTGSVIVEPNDTTLLATVVARIEMGSTILPPATVDFSGDSAITPADPSVGPGVLIDAQIAGQTTAEQSVLETQGIFINAGTITADGPAGSGFSIEVQAGSTIAGSFTNLGTLAVLAANEMVVTTGLGANFTSTGTVAVSNGGTLAIDSGVLGGAIINNGTILAVGDGPPGQTDTLEVSGVVTGTGTLAIGANGILKLDAAPTEAIAFPTSGAGLLILPGTGTYTTPLLNLATGDKIAIAGSAPITGVTVAGSTITIATASGNTVLTDATFAVGANQSFFSSLDGATSDWTIQVNAPGDTWTGSVSTNLGTAGNWTGGIPTAADSLNFNNGGTLTGAAVGLKANFNGAGGWVLNGANLTLAGNPNPPFDPYALVFNDNVTLNGATVIADGTASFAPGVTVTAQGGSSITDAGDTLGQNAGQFASLVLSGIGTNWTEVADPALNGNGNSTGYLTVGASGTGLVSVSNGASLSPSGLYVGNSAGGEGQLIVASGTVSDSQNLIIGQNGDGQATITAGGIVTWASTFAAVGDNAGSSGRLVIGAGGTLLATATPNPASTNYYLNIGDGGPSGALPTADGSVIVTGPGALLDTNGNPVSIGLNGGNGELVISNGGTALVGTPKSSNAASIAIGKYGNGLVEVTGAGSELLAVGGLYDGRGGTGDLIVSNGGFLDTTNDPTGNGGLEVAAGSSVFGTETGGSGVATVTSGGHIYVQAGMSVGENGANGVLNVTNGGSVEVGTRLGVGVGGVIGTLALGAIGVVNIGAGGTIQIDATTIAAGQAALYVGDFGGTQGSVNVDGVGALLNVGTQKISLGTLNSSITNSTTGEGSLSITQGGAVTAGILNVGGTGIGSADVQSGGGAAVNQIEVGGGEIVGTSTYAGQGSLNIGAASTVTVAGVGLGSAAAVAVGYFGGADGQVNVAGAGALLNVEGANYISLGTYNGTVNSTSGNGGMTVSQGAVANANQIQVGNTGSGALNVGGGGNINVGETLSVGDGTAVGAVAEAGFGVINIGATGTINVAGTGLAAGVAAVTAGSFIGATGIINVTGSHALLNLNGHDLRLGTNSGTPSSSGAGSLTTSFGGVVDAGTIVVGDTGVGSFNADIGGASATALDVGAQASGQGNIVLTSALTGVGVNALTIGDQGLGRVAATAGANLVVYSTAIIGNAAGSDGQLAVTGGAHFRTYSLIDGDSGTGALTVSGGATAEIINAATIGFGGSGGAGIGNLGIGAGGTVTVDGTGLATGTAALSVGDFANATGIITVSGSHALLNVGTHDIRLGTNAGTPSSSGTGILTASLGGVIDAGTIVVGDTGTGVFSANIGGASAAAVDVGAQATGQGSVLLTGALTGLGLNALTIGDQGYGKVTMTNGANLVVHGNVVLGNAAGATGQAAIASNAYFQANTLTVGGGGSGAFSVDSGAVLNALTIAAIGATGVLTLQGGKVAAGQVANQGNISGSGTVNAPLANNGVMTASGGALTVNGAISGTGVLAMGANGELVVGAVGAGQGFAFTAPGGVLELASLAATNASVIAGFGAGDQIQVVTASSIATSFNATTDALTITAGTASHTFQVTGTHTAADFTSSVVGVDTVLAANQTINLGTGPHLLYLGAASTNDTVVAPVLPSAGTSNFLDIFNFGGADTLDFRAALAGTTWGGTSGTLGNYLSVATSANSAVISLSATSGGAGVALVKLENSGPLTLSQVLAHATT
ncbi:MAG: hypothetical protein WBQ75_20095 [Acetobacteraceae bacterium]